MTEATVATLDSETSPRMGLVLRTIADAVRSGGLVGREQAMDAVVCELRDAGIDPLSELASALVEDAMGTLLDENGWARIGEGDARLSHFDDPAYPFIILAPEDEPKRACAEATWFAAAFLMPREPFESAWLETFGDVKVVARRFAVPVEAATGHAIALGLVSDDHSFVTKRTSKLSDHRAAAFLAACAEARADRLVRLTEAAGKALAGSDHPTRKAATAEKKTSPTAAKEPNADENSEKLDETVLAAMEREETERVILRRVSPARADAVELRLHPLDGWSVVRLRSPAGGSFHDRRRPGRAEPEAKDAAKDERPKAFGRDRRAAAAAFAKGLDDAVSTIDFAIERLKRNKPNLWLSYAVLRAFGWSDRSRDDSYGAIWSWPDGNSFFGPRLPNPCENIIDAEELAVPGWSFARSRLDDRTVIVSGVRATDGLTVSAAMATEAHALCLAKTMALKANGENERTAK